MTTFPYRTSIETAASTYDLVTLTRAKLELGITGDSQDDVLALQIADASAAARSYLCWPVVAETLIDRYRDLVCGSIWLSRYPVGVVTSVVEDGVTLTADDDYELDETTGQVWRLDGNDCRRMWTFRKVVATFVGGFNPVPVDIQKAVLKLLTQFRLSQGRDSQVKSEEVPGVLRQDFWVGAVGENGALPPDVSSLLDPYRRVPV